MQFQRKQIENYTYSLGDIVGRGFSSTVYRGINELTKEDVAIKVIQRKFSDQLPLIQNEIFMLQKLNGSNILKLYNFYNTKNNIYIITELCKGGDLQSYIKNSGRLNLQEALRIIAQIVNGIAVMQKKSKLIFYTDIIHRDLKPQNILLTYDCVKIADFGFAKEITQLNNEMNVGTPLYMSPETLIKNQYHIKSDIWSFGVMAYEIIYGQTLWKSQNERDLVYEITNSQIQFPDHIDVPDFIKQLIVGCLLVDVNKRYGIKDILNNRLFQKQRHCFALIKPKAKKIDLHASPLIPKISRTDGEQQNDESSLLGLVNYVNFVKFLLTENYKLLSPWLKEKIFILSSKHLTLLCGSLEINKQNNEQFNQVNEECQEQLQYWLGKVSDNSEFQNDTLRYDQEFLRLLKFFTKEGILKYLKMAIEELNHDLNRRIRLQNVISFSKELSILKTLLQYYELLKKYGLTPQLAKNDILYDLNLITHLKYITEYRHFLELRFEIKQILK